MNVFNPSTLALWTAETLIQNIVPVKSSWSPNITDETHRKSFKPNGKKRIPKKCGTHNFYPQKPRVTADPPEKRRRKTPILINREREKEEFSTQRPWSLPKESKGSILKSLTRDSSISLGSKVYFHTEFNKSLSTGMVLGSMRVKSRDTV